METTTPTSLLLQAFFRVCLLIDAIIVLVLLTDALLTGNDFDLVVQAGLFPGLAWYLRLRHPKWAAFLAAVPAVLIVSFITYMVLVLTTTHVHWQ